MVNRKFLYWGVFLVAAGGVLLVAQSDLVSAQAIDDALQLWPLLVIGLGVGLLLRHSPRTRLAVAGGVLAAAMPGLAVGGIVAAGPDMSVDCRFVEPATFETRDGSFMGSASVDVRLDCGDVTLTMVPGSGWHVETGDPAGAPPVIDASPDRLSVFSADRHGHLGFWGGDVFRLSLPAATTLDLAVDVNAGRGILDLAGGRFDVVEVDVNAGEARLDLTGATASRLSMDLNAAAATVQLPSGGDLAADFEVNAAKLTICVPGDLGLRIHEETTLGSSTFNGLVRNGSAWESPDYASATHHADMTVSVNVGSVDVNPEGGCK